MSLTIAIIDADTIMQAFLYRKLIEVLHPFPKLPVTRALCLPRPNLKPAAAACIQAGGAHHTGFSYSVTADHLRDFAEMAGIEFLLIDENTRLEEFKKELRWNDRLPLSPHLAHLIV